MIILILTTHRVLPPGAAVMLAKNADAIHSHGTLSLFASAVFAGALITAMTWFVEGQESMLVRVVVAWIAGALLALGSFDHVIVMTIELIFGYRLRRPLRVDVHRRQLLPRSRRQHARRARPRRR